MCETVVDGEAIRETWGDYMYFSRALSRREQTLHAILSPVGPRAHAGRNGEPSEQPITSRPFLTIVPGWDDEETREQGQAIPFRSGDQFVHWMPVH
jgi:hypothetical protein